MAKNNGRDYERFVEKVYQEILKADGLIGAKTIRIEKNKIIKNKLGIDREFDLYWKIEVGGQVYENVIECKDYASAISIEKIDAFIGKANEIPGMKLIYATRTGYQRGAKELAKKNNISLLVVREGKNEDWKNDNNEPLVREVEYNITMTPIPKIISFAPEIDGEWFDEQEWESREEILELFNKRFMNNEIFVFHCSLGKKISLQEYGAFLVENNKDVVYGENSYSKEVTDCFLVLPYKNADVSFKLKKYNLRYVYNEPISSTHTIDFSEQLVGVVHDVINDSRKRIFKK